MALPSLRSDNIYPDQNLVTMSAEQINRQLGNNFTAATAAKILEQTRLASGGMK